MGKRITELNETAGITDAHKLAIDLQGLAETEGITIEQLRDFINGTNTDKLILSKITAKAGQSSLTLISNITKHFVDYGKYAENNINNSGYHYSKLSWRITYNTIIEKNIQFADYNALTTWINNNLDATLLFDVELLPYFPIKLYDKKIINITPYNLCYKTLKGGYFGDYRDNTINTLLNNIPAVNSAVLEVWNQLLSGQTTPITTNLKECFVSRSRTGVYSAFKQFNVSPGGSQKFNFQTYESKGRQVFVPASGDFVDVNFILQNYQSYLNFTNTGKNVAILQDDSGNFTVLSEYDSKILYKEYYINRSIVRAYLLETTYYDGANIIPAYALAFKPLGQDYFVTRYYDNTKYSLYGYFKSNNAKPIVRKLNGMNYIGSETSNLGWSFTKNNLMRYIAHASTLFYKKGQALRDMQLFILEDATGNVSPLSDFAIKPKTKMRASDINLMLENI